MVGLQKEAVTLAGTLAGQKSFDELIGTAGISTLSQMVGLFKAIGASLINSLGPALNFILFLILKLVQVTDFFLELLGINTLLRMMGGQKFSYKPDKKAAEFLSIGGTKVDTGVAMAEGGIVTRRTNATIGEAGPEAVIPLDKFMTEFKTLKSEMSAVKDAIKSLKLTTKITNRDLNIVLTPSKT